MPDGLIVKALSGYYYVKPDQPADAGTVQCRARGLFKLHNTTPLVGDRVKFEYSNNGEGTVTEILPRSTELIRPPIANVEQAVLVFAVVEPELNLQLLDKFLVHVEHAGLTPLICLTKQDLAESGRKDPQSVPETIRNIYEPIGYRVLVTSASTGLGLDELRQALAGTISVFAGQSGVGKSTLLNALMPDLKLETGEISLKLGRGRHTTRHVELIPLPEGGWVADTPGFSQLDFLNMEADELKNCFPEMVQLSEHCRFRGCLHDKEPGCAVREAVEEGKVASSRYGHYALFLSEMREKKRRY